MNAFKIKAFTDTALSSLEVRVNKWLSQKYREITHIRYAKDGESHYLVIVYKEADE